MIGPGNPCRTTISPNPLSGCPWYFLSSGLGSNVSMWLTPPVMNSEMTALARGLKCGLRGEVAEPFCGPDTQACSPAVGAAKRPSCPNRLASASPLIPPPAVNNILRRDMAIVTSLFSVYINELIQVKDDVAEVGQCLERRR